MEQYPIKSVAFGGFDKQDVARYVEQMAQKRQELEEANADLQSQLDAARQEIDALQQKLQSAAAQEAQLETCTSELESARAEAERFRSNAQALQQEVDHLRGDAETYRQVRERLGSMELEAQKRADKLENEALLTLQQTVDLFRTQYQTLMSAFETTSSHVTGELRKMEVNLSQLPRAMDQSGTKLNELAAMLERKKKGE